jgi:hypothetical protein
MNKNISSILTSLNRKVSPGNVNQSKDIYGALGEAGRNLLSMIKPKELSKRVIIENALYDQVFRYKCPDDLDQKNVMQVYQLDGNRNTDTFYNPVMQATNRRYDQHRLGDKNLFTVEWDHGMKFIKMPSFGQNGTGISGANDGLTIHTMNSLTENGTWNVFGNVTNLATDNLTYVAGTGSLRFDINTSSTTGGIENFTLTPFDITDYLNVGKTFTWLNLPNLNQIQTIQFEMYSSAGNGYSITVNSPHNTDSFQLDQNLLGFYLDSSTMTTIGTPDPKTINHIKFTFTTNGTLLMNSVRMDNIVARKGKVYGIQYVSNHMFVDVNGLTKQDPTVPSDEILLEYEAYQIYLEEASCVLGQEIFTDTGTNRKGQTFGKLGQMQEHLMQQYRLYKKRWKEEFIPEQQDMYRWGVNFGYNNRGNWNGDGGRFDHGSNGDSW